MRIILFILFILLLSCSKPSNDDYDYHYITPETKDTIVTGYGNVSFENADTTLSGCYLVLEHDSIYFFHKYLLKKQPNIKTRAKIIWIDINNIVYIMEGYYTPKKSSTIDCILGWKTYVYHDDNPFIGTNKYWYHQSD